MPVNSEFEIVLDPDALSEDHVATIISARESNIKELQRCVSPAIMGQKPPVLMALRQARHRQNHCRMSYPFGDEQENQDTGDIC